MQYQQMSLEIPLSLILDHMQAEKERIELQSFGAFHIIPIISQLEQIIYIIMFQIKPDYKNTNLTIKSHVPTNIFSL